MRKGSGLNVLGVIFGILSILIVIGVAAALLGRQPFRLPIDFRFNMNMEKMEEMFTGNSMEEKGTQEFRGRIDDIVIENIAGKIEINGWNEDYIKLDYIKSAPSQKHLDNLVVDIEERGRTLQIEREFIGEGISPRGSIAFILNIPKGVIEDLNAKSVSGRIVCSNMSRETDINLQTTSGRMQTDACNDFKAKTISGEIKFISFGEDVEIRSTSGRVEGEYRSTERRGRIDVHTVSGAVRLVLPDEFQGNVDLQSISGSVDIAFPVQVTSSKRNSIEGTIGDGNVLIDVNSTSGSIRLMKASGDE